MLRIFSRTFLFVALLLPLIAGAQRPFQDEVDQFKVKDARVVAKNLYLFTGSSTIRMWSDLESTFPEKNVVNRGFGGSQMTDLLYYVDRIILRHKPKKIFIYEGDNDLASKKTPDQIIATADSLLQKIRTKLPSVTIAFIYAKPSIARWELKEHYLEYNRKLTAWAETKKNVITIDVWTPMMDANGEVMKDIFLEDGLHMNKKGYDIWANVMNPHLEK